MTFNPNPLVAVVPISKPHNAPPGTILTTSFTTVMENIPDTIARRDFIQEFQAARIDAMKLDMMQKATRAIQVQAFADSINHLTSRLDAIETKRAKVKAKHERQRLDQLMSGWPDPDNPETFLGMLAEAPIPAQDGMLDPDDPEGPATYPPDGRLHTIGPTTGDPALTDEEGDLPKQIERRTPPPMGEYPNPPPARQPQFTSPATFTSDDD